MLDINLDIFSVLIFLGVVQGFFLSLFFFFGKKIKTTADNILGFLILALSLCMLEVFLNYSNLILKVLWSVDFAESLTFTIGPLYYIYTLSTFQKKIQPRKYLHFLPFFMYLLYSCFYFFQGWEYKYNSFLEAYHPEMPHLVHKMEYSDDPLNIRDVVNELIILHFLIYFVLSYRIFSNKLREDNLKLFTKLSLKLSFLRFFVLQFGFLLVLFISVKLFFVHDLGDYIICSYATVTIYALGFQALREKELFQAYSVDSKKYIKSGLNDELKIEILKKVLDVMEREKYYTNKLISLPDLAKKVNTSANNLSQVLNEKLNTTFFEFIANYRAKEAQDILSDKSNSNLKIEDIAELVGYNSKSAFNTAFKKYTGKTPSDFRKNLSSIEI